MQEEFLPGFQPELMGELPWRRRGEREEGRQGGQGEGMVVLCLLCTLSPCPLSSFKSKHGEIPARCSTGGLRGQQKGQHEATSRDLHPFSLLLSGRYPHGLLPGPGMTLRSMSPLVNISFSFALSSVIPDVLIAIAGSHSLSLCSVFPPAFRAGKVQHPKEHLEGW